MASHHVLLPFLLLVSSLLVPNLIDQFHCRVKQTHPSVDRGSSHSPSTSGLEDDPKAVYEDHQLNGRGWIVVKRLNRIADLIITSMVVPVAIFTMLPVCGGFPATLALERAFPIKAAVNATDLVQHDQMKHGRMLQGIIDYELNRSLAKGLYYTRIQLGSPPREFYVVLDTGSDVLWVNCVFCKGCPTYRDTPHYFDLRSSATARPITCQHNKCFGGDKSALSRCSSNVCHYDQIYEDGSSVSGFYVADLLHITVVPNDPVTSNTTAPVAFGCSTKAGNFLAPDLTMDGIMGLGPNGMSIISQLAAEGIAPWAFSHCLRGNGEGGGILVLGAVEVPNIVYTPIIPHQKHYNVNLRSISLNGAMVPINPSAFATSRYRGTIIDSGTVLTYLVDEAYNALVGEVTRSVSQVAISYPSGPLQCYVISTSIDLFPQVRLDFDGNASLLVGPEDYLQQHTILSDGPSMWCLGFLRSNTPGLNILGDLVLRNKIVVYDLAAQKIGWVDYDCSTPVNVSTTYGRGPRPSSSIKVIPSWIILPIILLFMSLKV